MENSIISMTLRIVDGRSSPERGVLRNDKIISLECKMFAGAR
jgi:hypothetical protein